MTHRRDWRGVLVGVLVLGLLVGPAQAGLQAYWTFDEGTGPTVTDSVNGNVGTLTNGASFSSSVPAAIGSGSSLVFDGTNDFVNVPDSPSVSPTGNITLSAWVNAATFAGSSKNILAKDTNNSYRWRLNGGDGQLWLLLNDGAGSPPYELFFSGVSASTGTWHHTAVTADLTDNTVCFYLDGSLVATKAITATTHVRDTGGALLIGAYSGSGNEGFAGNIDDVAMWDQALGDDLIEQLAMGHNPRNIPEPATLSLLALGALALLRRRRRS